MTIPGPLGAGDLPTPHPTHPTPPHTTTPSQALHRQNTKWSRMWAYGTASTSWDKHLSPPSAPLGPMVWLGAGWLGGWPPCGGRVHQRVLNGEALCLPVLPAVPIFVLLILCGWFQAPRSNRGQCRATRSIIPAGHGLPACTTHKPHERWHEQRDPRRGAWSARPGPSGAMAAVRPFVEEGVDLACICPSGAETTRPLTEN